MTCELKLTSFEYDSKRQFAVVYTLAFAVPSTAAATRAAQGLAEINATSLQRARLPRTLITRHLIHTVRYVQCLISGSIYIRWSFHRRFMRNC